MIKKSDAKGGVMDSSRISTDAPLKENDLNNEIQYERILSFIEVSEDEEG